MILVSNGTRTYAFENADLSLNDILTSYRGPGYCFEIATYPSQDQTSLTAINNVAAPAFLDDAKSAQCMINFDAKNYVWATVVNPKSGLYTKIVKHYITPEAPAAEPEPAPASESDFDAKKIQQIRDLLSGLTEKEIAALTKK